MRLHTFLNAFLVQPSRGATGSTLRIDRTTNAMTITKENVDITLAYSQFIYGVVGIARLLQNNYLIVITDCKTVASIDGCDIYRLERTKILPILVGVAPTGLII